MRLSAADVIKFWSKVDKSGGPDSCWPWTGALTNGYGAFTTGGGTLLRANRVAFELVNRPLVNLALHDCPGGDRRECCNPRHLWDGTHRQNTQDMIAKGRQGWLTHPERWYKGEGNGRAKLTTLQVRVIRSIYALGYDTQKVLAKRYGVSDVLISLVVRRKNWRHI